MSQRFLGWFMLVALGILPALVFSYLTVKGVRGWVDSGRARRVRILTFLMVTLLSCANICTAVVLLQLAPAAFVVLIVVFCVCAIAGIITSLVLIGMWVLPIFQTRQR